MSLSRSSNCHVCVDARLWNGGGIGTFLKNILRILQKESDIALTLLCCPNEKEALIEEGFTRLIPIRSALFSLKEQVEMPLKIPSADLFWSPHFSIPVLPIRARQRLTTIHDTYHLVYRKQYSLPARTYAKWMYQKAVRVSDVVTTVSQFSYEQIRTYCGNFSTPLHVISPGVSKIFHPFYSEERFAEIRAQYTLPKRFLLMIGNFKKHKNLPRVLEALKKLPEELHLVLVGKEGALGKRVKGISFIPEKDLPLIYCLAQALLFPSLYEGFGSPPLEAMACGCPAIVAKTASLPEVCSDAVEYIDPLSVDSIRQGIMKVMEDSERREILIEKGMQRAFLFNWNTCAQAYLSLIRGIVKQ